MPEEKFKGGFTLIELTLSMVFVGILSVAVVLIINDTVAAYRRGMTLNHVTTTGMDIVDDIRTAVQNSTSRSVTNLCYTYYKEGSDGRRDCINDDAYNFIAWTKYADVTMGNDVLKDVPIYGAFCTGTYSYVWNTGYYYMPEATFTEKNNGKWATLTYLNGEKQKTVLGGALDGSDKKPFKLLKIRDNYRGVCASVVRGGAQISGDNFADFNLTYKFEGNISGNFDMTGYGAVTEEPVDIILEDNDNDLALFDLAVARPAESATRKNTFYSVSFILGTIQGGVNIKAAGKSCETPENYDIGYFEYCAINRFNFAVQAGGE